jgi:hypothetical protein
MVTAKTTTGEPIIPGLLYTQSLNATGSVEDYTDRFNATSTIDEWSGTTSTSNLFGDVFSAVSQFWDSFRFLFDGIGTLLDYFGSMLTGGLNAFNVVAGAIRVLSAFMAITLIIEIIGGREFLP